MFKEISKAYPPNSQGGDIGESGGLGDVGDLGGLFVCRVVVVGFVDFG